MNKTERQPSGWKPSQVRNIILKKGKETNYGKCSTNRCNRIRRFSSAQLTALTCSQGKGCGAQCS